MCFWPNVVIRSACALEELTPNWVTFRDGFGRVRYGLIDVKAGNDKIKIVLSIDNGRNMTFYFLKFNKLFKQLLEGKNRIGDDFIVQFYDFSHAFK